MLQNRLAVVPQSQISLAVPNGLERLLGGVPRRLAAITPPQILIALLAIGGQFGLASAALSQNPDLQPDGGSAMRLLLPYGAVMLGYLSSYWGLWKPVDAAYDAPYSPRRAALAERGRLIASLAPTIIGGISLLMPMFFTATVGLVVLLGGFILMFAMEVFGNRRGMPIATYQGLRWTITIFVIAILINVATVRIWSISLFF